MTLSLKKLIAIFLVLVAIGVSLYFLFGQALVTSIYNEKAPKFLNNLISGRSKHDLKFYLEQADTYVFVYGLRFVVFGLLAYFVVGVDWFKKMAFIIFNIAILFVLFESFFFFCFKNASFAKKVGVHDLLHGLHSNFGWQIPQFEPDCAVYDEKLGYRLKEGECTLSNYEFESLLKPNSLGLPDDEDSLDRPEIIVLGDSFTMGWGVNPDQTFSALVEEKTGMKVLNTGISSYGTARELELFKELDSSNLKFLIIQYFQNDHIENRALKEKGSLQVMSQKDYQKQVASYQENKKYFWGKYAYKAFALFEKSFARKFLNIEEEVKPGWRKDDVTDLFLNALNTSSLKEKADLKILVFDASPAESLFIDELGKKISSRGSWDNLRILKVSDKLSSENYYDYDPHYRPKGHEIIADILSKEILKDG